MRPFDLPDKEISFSLGFPKASAPKTALTNKRINELFTILKIIQIIFLNLELVVLAQI